MKLYLNNDSSLTRKNMEKTLQQHKYKDVGGPRD